MRSFIKSGLLIIAAIIFQSSALYADWWGQAVTPVPSGARKITEENRMIDGSKQHFTYYVTDDSAGAVKDFYRKELNSSGWGEINLAGMLPPSGAPIAASSLVFENKDERIIIVFPPVGYFQDGKIRFTISRGRIKSETEAGGTNNMGMALLAKPKKDIAPVYPGATLISLTENSTQQKAGYYAKGDLGEVAAFYRDNMVLKGWQLKVESPVSKISGGDCPECKARKIDTKGIQVLTKRLTFIDERGETCDIVISQTSLGKKIPDFGDSIINILVAYEAKH